MKNGVKSILAAVYNFYFINFLQASPVHNAFIKILRNLTTIIRNLTNILLRYLEDKATGMQKRSAIEGKFSYNVKVSRLINRALFLLWSKFEKKTLFRFSNFINHNKNNTQFINWNTYRPTYRVRGLKLMHFRRTFSLDSMTFWSKANNFGDPEIGRFDIKYPVFVSSTLLGLHGLRKRRYNVFYRR